MVDFVGKVLYEKNMKNESYREIFRTAEIHHNPPQSPQLAIAFASGYFIPGCCRAAVRYTERRQLPDFPAFLTHRKLYTFQDVNSVARKVYSYEAPAAPALSAGLAGKAANNERTMRKAVFCNTIHAGFLDTITRAI